MARFRFGLAAWLIALQELAPEPWSCMPGPCRNLLRIMARASRRSCERSWRNLNSSTAGPQDTIASFWGANLSKSRLVSAQPVDATPSNQLIPQYFPWGTDLFGCPRSKPSQGSVPADLTFRPSSLTRFLMPPKMCCACHAATLYSAKRSRTIASSRSSVAEVWA